MIRVADKERQVPVPERSPASADTANRELVYCAICSHLIARLADRCEINGQHAHNCTNPYGVRFDVRCFGEALGAAISGPPVAADSWFPGFAWRLLTCTDCQAHIGWYFERGREYFYGLVANSIQYD